MEEADASIWGACGSCDDDMDGGNRVRDASDGAREAFGRGVPDVRSCGQDGAADLLYRGRCGC